MISLRRTRGFTLIELMTTVAVIGILAALAMGAYTLYMDRARATEIEVQYDALKTKTAVALSGGVEVECADLLAQYGGQALSSPYAALSYQFEPIAGDPLGFRPVMNVCANVQSQGVAGVKVANAAHGNLLPNGVVQPGAVVTPSVVSFSLRLLDADKALCVVRQKPLAIPTSTVACAPASSGLVASLSGPVLTGQGVGSTPTVGGLVPAPSANLVQATATGPSVPGPKAPAPQTCPADQMIYPTDKQCHPKPSQPCNPPGRLYWYANGPDTLIICARPGQPTELLQIALPSPEKGPDKPRSSRTCDSATQITRVDSHTGALSCVQKLNCPASEIQYANDGLCHPRPEGVCLSPSRLIWYTTAPGRGTILCLAPDNTIKTLKPVLPAGGLVQGVANGSTSPPSGSSATLPKPAACEPGQHNDPGNVTRCVPDKAVCAPGQHNNPLDVTKCVPSRAVCEPGQRNDPADVTRCVPPPAKCQPGQRNDPADVTRCVPPPAQCPGGQHPDPNNVTRCLADAVRDPCAAQTNYGHWRQCRQGQSLPVSQALFNSRNQ